MTTSLETLIHDERLRRLFKTPDAHCAVQFWLLQIKKKENTETLLLYGRILPYSFSNNKWSAPKEDSFKSFDAYKAQVIRINLYCEASKVSKLIASLASGKNIAYISNDLELDMPSGFQNRFGNFCLSEKRCYRPVSYLPMRDDFYSRGLKSPHGSAGAFSAAITPFGKDALLLCNGNIDHALLSYATTQISSDTGMSFAKEDAARWGDLELLVFPTLDDYERNLLRIDGGKGKVINVSLEEEKDTPYDFYYIKTSFTNDQQIVHSCVTAAQVLNSVVSADFELPDYLNGVVDGLHVEIHAQKISDMSAILYCQYSVAYVREVNLSIYNLTTSVSGTVQSDWLTKVTKLASNSARITNVQSINQGTASSSSVVGGRQNDPWVSINRNARDFFEKLHPPTSEARFFKCYKDGDGLGRLEFVEWIKNILNSHQKHQVIIFDPYFEDVGISLLVPNASSGSDYIVFTTSESRTEGQRLNNLSSSCEQLSILLNHIRLRVFALPNGSFHDRYILIADQGGKPLKGYHLSNSIQKANENFPLLITPIPLDVLIKVNEYAQEVLTKELKPCDATCTTVHPFFDSQLKHEKINEARHRYEPLLFLDNQDAGIVLAAWAGEQELACLKSEFLKDKLVQLGLLEGETLSGDRFASCEMAFGFLVKSDDKSFNQYWNVAGDILAHTPSGDSLASCTIAHNEALCNRLLIYLKGKATELALDAYDVQNAFSYFQRLNDSIDKILPHGRPSDFHHGIKFAALSWADYFAIKILWHHSPSRLLDFIEEVNKSISGDVINYKREKNRDYSVLAQTISEVALNCIFGLTETQISLLINRTNALFKWFGYCGFETSINQNISSLSIIANMQKPEKIMLLGWMINRTPIKDVGQNALFGKLVSEYLTVLPVVLSKNDLTACIDSLRGHMRLLGWCEPWLFKLIVTPLIDGNRVSLDDLASIWFEEMKSLFEDCLSDHSSGFTFAHEGVTTDIAAYLIAHSSFECQKCILGSLKVMLNNLSRDIQKPLASTSNWKRWDASLKTTLWIYGLTKWIDFHLPLPNLAQSLLLAQINAAYKLSMHRSISEWESHNYTGGEFSIFLKNRSELN